MFQGFLARIVEQEIKSKGVIFCWKNNVKICSGGDKMRNASDHQCKEKMRVSEEKVDENAYDVPSIKKFLEVSRCSRAKQRQRNVQKKCAARAKLCFC